MNGKADVDTALVCDGRLPLDFMVKWISTNHMEQFVYIEHLEY